MSNLPTLREIMREHPAPESVTTTEQPAGAASQTATPPASATALAEADAGDLDAAKREAPLLARIQQDTGETGRATGDRIDFTVCPICGHRGCFSYYSASNSWSCFSASNTTGIPGGSYVDYLCAREGVTVAEAVARLREETGHPLPAKAKNDKTKDGKGKELILPPWSNSRANNPRALKPELIPGMLRMGTVGLIVGKGKTGKSFLMFELCAAAAFGGSWLGKQIRRGRCLFVNPELTEEEADGRESAICRRLGLDPNEYARAVQRWDLLGVKEATIETIVHDIEVREESFALIVFDSVTAFFRGNENDATDVRAFMMTFYQIAQMTGAAVMVVHHEGKAQPYQRAASDRARGSSAWRDCVHLFMTVDETRPTGEAQLEGNQSALLLEVDGLRSFKPHPPIRMIWDYPVHVLDSTGATASYTLDGGRPAKEKADRKTARAEKCERALLVEFLKRGDECRRIGAGEAAEVCASSLGSNVATSTLRGYIEESEVFGIEVEGNSSRWWVVRNDGPETQVD